MVIELLTMQDSACEAFIAKMPDSRIWHLPSWSNAVCRAMRLKDYYLVARDGRDVHGVLPLVYVCSRIFGTFMVSQAFSNYGGLLADSSQARDSLFTRALELATELNCESIEFRNIEPLPYDLFSRTEKLCMHLSLDSDAEELWKSFKPKVRNQVRKAEKSNLKTNVGGMNLLNDFHRVYSIRMGQLGTPCYSRRLMREILQSFPDNARIFTVTLDNLTVASGLTVCFNGFVEIPWAATLVQYNNLCPNNLLYWSVIRHYCQAGASCFDFGRCTVNGPTYRFKKQWGSLPIQLHYQYWVRPGHKLSITTPTNPRYQKKVKMWKKLPLWLTRLLGPCISRKLP